MKSLILQITELRAATGCSVNEAKEMLGIEEVFTEPSYGWRRVDGTWAPGHQEPGPSIFDVHHAAE